MEPRDLVQLVETGDRFKLMAPSRSKGKAVRGVKLSVEHAPPPALPLQPGLHYFRVHHSVNDRMWQAVASESAMVVVGVEEEVTDFGVALYMMMPAPEGRGE